MRSLFLSAVLAAASAVSWPAAAEGPLKTAITAAELDSLLNGAGLPSDVSEDPQNGVAALSRLGDVAFTVRALNCKGAPRACGTLIFYANFSLGRAPTQADYDAINRFNDGEVFGRAYVRKAEGEIGVDYVVELDGGVTPEHLARNVARWRKVVSEFLARFAATPNS